MRSDPEEPTAFARSPVVRAAVVLVAASAALYLFYAHGFTGDYYMYWDAARDWLSGEVELYERYGFFYMPWTMLFIAPTSLLGLKMGSAVFNLVSMACLIYAVMASARGPRRNVAMLLAVLAPFSLIIVYMSQWDTLTMAAALAGWVAARDRRPWLLGLALVVLASKPTNVWLPGLLILIMIARWPLVDLARTFVLPAGAVASSVVIAGWDWPLRYWQMLQLEPPRSVNVALMQHSVGGIPLGILSGFLLLGTLGWVARRARRGIARSDLILALSLNLLLTPYSVPYHFAQTAPAIALTASRSLLLGLVAYAAALGGVLLFWSYSGSPVMNLYPATIVVLCGVAIARFEREDEQSKKPTS